MHETLPHGDQILDSLSGETLNQRQQAELVEGAGKAGLMYLRIVDWALKPAALSRSVEVNDASLSAEEYEKIDRFNVTEIGL